MAEPESGADDGRLRELLAIETRLRISSALPKRTPPVELPPRAPPASIVWLQPDTLLSRRTTCAPARSVWPMRRRWRRLKQGIKRRLPPSRTSPIGTLTSWPAGRWNR